ncbi:uncharacterized protein C19C2.10 [Aspergillus udagawae]|uniref:Uncharacterized protein C19C2.10 n=1 Tax=Aspergillus udagawae TaxID=91492 RepID=A0A8H3N8Y9_9EURO|nr:uncharacterized protein Aud_006287 [Aspergillus udagawae]GFF22016.1 uncharacterized protein C19C2.10 [Aspergillus udagawae]GFF28103.1 uncharacterized protein C19C2.10 [Aspergillus udagawae]GFF70163.1 uncharacterized protein C19C2.10 [Aspergillus udagawae]GFG03923.1 uncharacterized protein C19C2.10 [Aspergillus udagawae]GFG21304.1 uncharacterized protein C19C2.10 [Aspergillus udagawae]
MNVNKKLDRFKQWAGERMGGEVKTNLSDDFKALETEMNVKHEGADRIHKSLIAYLKSISKRSEGDDKEKTLPIAHLGSSMVSHGEDFDANSEYGRCLTMFGRAEERIARVQETYISQATATYLESLERSLAQMKEYQAARKKLDSRRLAYDTSLSKMQKAKKEDFRVEEELRTQKVKYEEANEDVYRRMYDIKDAEVEGVAELAAFLEAQLNYHERCREVLLQIKNDWPADQFQSQTPNGRRTGRARSNTAHSYHERYEPLHEELTNGVSPRPIIRSDRHTSSVPPTLPVTEAYPVETPYQRPILNRTSTFEGPSQLRHLQPSGSSSWQSRATSENFVSRRDSSHPRPVSMMPDNPYSDSYEESTAHVNSHSDVFYQGRSSPPSYGNAISRRASSGTLNSSALNKKAPPPPPPSRAKKPPPPPPVKRPMLSVGDV